MVGPICQGLAALGEATPADGASSARGRDVPKVRSKRAGRRSHPGILTSNPSMTREYSAKRSATSASTPATQQGIRPNPACSCPDPGPQSLSTSAPQQPLRRQARRRQSVNSAMIVAAHRMACSARACRSTWLSLRGAFSMAFPFACARSHAMPVASVVRSYSLPGPAGIGRGAARSLVERYM
jgi:hypothetical protein